MASSHESVEDLLASLMELPVASVDIGQYSDDPRSGGSEQNRATVKLQNGQVLDLFMKIIIDGSVAQKYDEFLHIYSKEKTFFSEILPEMISYQNLKSKGISSLHSLEEMFPKYYGCGKVGGDLYLVFGDFIKNSTFMVTGLEDFHSCDQIKAVLSQLGGFHAVSNAIQAQMETPFDVKYPILKDFLTHPDNKEKMFEMFSSKFNHNINLLEAVRKQFLLKDPVLAGKAVNKVCSESILTRMKRFTGHLTDIMFQIQAPEQPTALVAHGDFHMWNVAFSGTKVKFFDLQLVKYSSGLIDVHHYLSQVSTPQDRSKHLDLFLSAYQEGFDTVSEEMGAPRSTVYTKAGILEEYKKRAPWGLFMGFCWILGRFVKDQDSFKSTENLENAKEIVAKLDNSGPKIWWAIQVLFDFLEEMETLGAFDQMDKLLLEII